MNRSLSKYFSKLVVMFVLITIYIKTTAPIFAQVVINEFSPSSDTEWIEFYNASSSAEYIKTYYIDDDTSFSDDAGSTTKKSLSGLNTANQQFPYFEVSSFLNNSGDYVVLFNSEGGKLDEFHYNQNPGDGVTIGRYPDQTGTFNPLTSATKGSPNAGPISSPTIASSPQPSPTPLSIPKPTSYASPKATTIPIKKSSPIPTKKPTPRPSSEVLGTAETSPSPQVSPSPMTTGGGGNRIPAGLLFIAGGLLFSGAAGYMFYKKMEFKNPTSYN